MGAVNELKVTETPLRGASIVTPTVFEDERGSFQESWNAARFNEAIGHPVEFVQDSQSRSGAWVLRGLHYQLPRSQAKLVRCVTGAIFDVIVDLRRSSDTFGSWFGVELSAHVASQLWVPEGFAHGFLSLSEDTVVAYKSTDYYAPQAQHALRWDDIAVGVEWPLAGAEPVVSPADAAGLALDELPHFD